MIMYSGVSSVSFIPKVKKSVPMNDSMEEYIDAITCTRRGDPAPYFNLCINQMLENIL
ncbi:hypothetical protein PROFUN_05311 [Planoprotostelium fungivorum]|uniref:Uncharacterized protein n=1 Tax=Planoprotostelium fungivorum TaxID=1890364 RepID=A0A2P6NRE1_9EUKA|nr:hypothetical protein PROFUN_05311 [Planoprotostelium fungivorum]